MALHKLKIVAHNDRHPVAYFRAGTAIPETGIYRVYHSDHRVSHEVVLLQGEYFPECAKCGDDVHFQLLHTAHQIAMDADFRRNPIRLYKIPHPVEDNTQEQGPLGLVM